MPPVLVSRGGPAALNMDFTNICGLASNFPSIQFHLSKAKPHFLFLTETQISSDSGGGFYVPSYQLHSKFSFKGGCCAYVRSDVVCTRASHLESDEFSALWLRFAGEPIAKFICCLYMSPTVDSLAFYQYLLFSVDRILTLSPCSEIVILGDFNAHHSEWLSSPRTDQRGLLVFDLAEHFDLTQLVVGPTRYPDREGDSPNTLDLFLTSNPLPYTINLCPPLGTSDHVLVSVSSLSSNVQVERPPQLERRRLWHYGGADWTTFRDHLSSFDWENDCFCDDDVSEVAVRVTKVILDAMWSYIPSSLQSLKPSKVWFDAECGRAIRRRDIAFRKFRRVMTSGARSAYVRLRNDAKRVLRNAKDSFIRERCRGLAGSSSSRAFWHLAKNIPTNFASPSFPPLLSPDGSVAVLPSAKAELFAEFFANNSNMDDAGAVPPSPPASEVMMPVVDISDAEVH